MTLSTQTKLLQAGVILHERRDCQACFRKMNVVLSCIARISHELGEY